MRLVGLLALAGCGSPSAAVDSGSPPFCPRVGAVVCEDFDSTPAPSTAWSIFARGSATAAADSISAVSLPSSFLIRVPADAKGRSAHALLWSTSARLDRATLDLAFRADTLPAILTIGVLAYASDGYHVGVQIAMGNLYVVENRNGISDSPLYVGHVSLGAWHAIELVVNTAGRTLESSLDGERASIPIASTQSFTLAGEKRLLVGIVESSNVLPETVVRFDNVSFFDR